MAAALAWRRASADLAAMAEALAAVKRMGTLVVLIAWGVKHNL